MGNRLIYRDQFGHTIERDMQALLDSRWYFWLCAAKKSTEVVEADLVVSYSESALHFNHDTEAVAHPKVL